MEIVHNAVRGKKQQRILERDTLLAQGKNPQFPEDKKRINDAMKRDPSFIKNMFNFEGEDVPSGKGMMSPLEAKQKMF